MDESIVFLSNLNKALQQIEQEIVDRTTACLLIAETKLQHDPFTTDYEVEATVEYYTETSEDHVHSFWQPFSYKNTIGNKDYGMLLDNGNGTDWHREGRMPELETPYCYLLHDLMSHSTLEDDLYTITRIWVDVVYTDQKCLLINKDGSSNKLIQEKWSTIFSK